MARAQRSQAEDIFASTIANGLELLGLTNALGRGRRTVVSRSTAAASVRLDPEFFLSREESDLRRQLPTPNGLLRDLCDDISSGVTPSKDEYVSSGKPILK